MNTYSRFLFFIAALFAAPLLVAQDDPQWSPNELYFIQKNNWIAKRITAMYSNRAQADTATSKLYGSQDTRSFTIWEDQWLNKRPEAWYYFGWFATGIPDNALTEFIVHMTPVSRDTLLANWYHIPNAEQYKREWERAEPFRNLDPETLLSRPSACRCYLFLSTEGNREGHMQTIVPCPFTSTTGSKFKYIYFDVLMKNNAHVAKNKYFDKDFNVVFEFKTPSEFKLISRNRFKFTEEDKED